MALAGREERERAFLSSLCLYTQRTARYIQSFRQQTKEVAVGFPLCIFSRRLSVYPAFVYD